MRPAAQRSAPTLFGHAALIGHSRESTDWLSMRNQPGASCRLEKVSGGSSSQLEVLSRSDVWTLRSPQSHTRTRYRAIDGTLTGIVYRPPEA